MSVRTLCLLMVGCIRWAHWAWVTGAYGWCFWTMARRRVRHLLMRWALRRIGGRATLFCLNLGLLCQARIMGAYGWCFWTMARRRVRHLLMSGALCGIRARAELFCLDPGLLFWFARWALCNIRARATLFCLDLRSLFSTTPPEVHLSIAHFHTKRGPKNSLGVEGNLIQIGFS
ncbi:MAG: hypothetical protein LBJ70_03170 [Holosporales bacterium]|nr:hypothetical protein [Holosporales bacterium]